MIASQATNDYIKRKLQAAKHRYQNQPNANAKPGGGMPMYRSGKGNELIAEVCMRVYTYAASVSCVGMYVYIRIYRIVAF